MLALTVFVFCSAACVGGEALKVKPGVEGTARSNYYQAMIELKGANYLQASTLFTLVARSPSYVKYGALAQLRLADVLFLQGRYRAATVKYAAFVAAHPSDANMPYARFRAAQAYYEQLPSDIFVLPPSHEGDQTVTHEARRELSRFIRDFPISRFTSDAQRMLRQTEQLLCNHELYVADFYQNKNKPRAVAWRLQGAIETYPKCALTEENVLRLGASYAKAGSQVDAAKAYTLYIEKFPKGAERARLESKLRKIKEESAPKAPPKSSD
jgi:outer membrane protein assembly factor BamD